MKKLAVFVACLVILTSGCQSDKAGEGGVDSTAVNAIDAEGLAAHIQTLSSDEFQGRQPFTEGEEKTIQYLQTEFQKAGLQPGVGESYFQEVPLVEINSEPQGQLLINGEGKKLALDYLDDYVAISRRMSAEVEVNDSELVFAGFGIVAPEYGWNDYEGLDAAGKTVVVMVNDPGFYAEDSALFKGKAMTYYGRWTYKYEEAARQGAEGVIIIHDTDPASYPWSVVRGGWSGPAQYLQAEDGNMSRAAMEGWITLDAAKQLFALAGLDSSVMQEAGTPGFKPVPLGLTASLTIRNSLKESVSRNVIGVYPGTDLKDECIVYTAHWDHLGVGEPVDGDSIYNGAVDNATGTAALIEIAEAFAALEQKPRRSIVFLAVTAEEQGLLGSEYYVNNPVFPVEKTVANINMDALYAYGSTKDLIMVGYGQSELEDLAEASAEKMGMHITPDQNPSAGYFFRSDHFNFAKKGIPALYAKSGVESTAHGKDWGMEQQKAYTAHKYHAPSDEYDPESWDMSGIVDYCRLVFDVGRKLAASDDFPQWKEGSEFKSARESVNNSDPPVRH